DKDTQGLRHSSRSWYHPWYFRPKEYAGRSGYEVNRDRKGCCRLGRLCIIRQEIRIRTSLARCAAVRGACKNRVGDVPRDTREVHSEVKIRDQPHYACGVSSGETTEPRNHYVRRAFPVRVGLLRTQVDQHTEH